MARCIGSEHLSQMTPSPVRALDVDVERLPSGKWKGRNRVSGEVYEAETADDVMRWLSRRTAA